MGPLKKQRRWKMARTSRSARRSSALVLSVLLAAASVSLVVLGLLSWFTPRQQAVQIHPNAWVDLTVTPLFDPGASIFAAPDSDGATPSPAGLACTIQVRGGVGREAIEPASPDIGSRVRDGEALAPIINLGRVPGGSRLLCQGAYLNHGLAWVLPSEPARSPAGMALIVAGVGCLGLAVLTNPRVRGYTPR